MGVSIQLVRGDITRLDVDAVVNAANSALAGGGGVDGAIHRAAGPRLDEECAAIRAAYGGCAPGDAVATSGCGLKARYIILAVGPVRRGGGQGDAALLRGCYERSLRLAEELSLASIAFPNISTGVYGFPTVRRQARNLIPGLLARRTMMYERFGAAAIGTSLAASAARPLAVS